MQALTQAQHVKLTGTFTGNTPSIMAPATISPLNPEDQSATPLTDSSGMPAVHGKLMLNLISL